MAATSSVTKTRFRDQVEREKRALKAAQNELTRLGRKKAKGPLAPEDQTRYDRLEQLVKLAEDESIDPVFVAVRDAFNDPETIGLLNKILLNHEDGVLVAGPLTAEARRAMAAFAGVGFERRKADRRRAAAQDDDVEISADDVVRVAYVLGILASDKELTPPRVRILKENGENEKRKNFAGARVVTATSDRNYSDFITRFYAALGEARASLSLARLVLPILQQEGDRDGSGKSPGEVDAGEFARVMRTLREKGVTADELQLRRRVNDALDRIQSVGSDTSVPDMAIDLPDLNEITNYQIQAENVEAMGPMICAAMFDELKAFDVVDKLVELWQAGLLPIGVSDAGRMLYDYWKSAPNRMSEAERRNFYAITMGIPGGPANGPANKEFNDLWIRFVSSVSTLVRQRTTDQLLRNAIPVSVNQQQVRKAARDLALNLSRHAYGMVNYAARDLQKQIRNIIDLLGHPHIKQAYGAHDMWQVIDQVASLELGGARNSARYRTLATCGAIITKWLSLNVRKFNSATTLQQVIDLDQVLSFDPPSAGANATKNPTDYDLVNACELWRLDTAISDNRIEEMSQPREAPAMTSKPVPVPSFGREISDLIAENLPAAFAHGMPATRH